ncbi:MAG TPA: EI24 domain-containing protein [Rubrivivax sp.]
MSPVLDAFWRAAAYCVHPRVILWSLLPLAVAGAAVFGLGWYFWEDVVRQVRSALEEWSLVESLLAWLEANGGGAFRSVLAPLVVVALAVPVVVIASLLLVAWLMTPALVRLVAARRFAALQPLGSASAWLQGVLWSIGCALVALLLLCVTIPLWFVPPLVLVLPPLVWGWLASRVLSFDALATHATTAERRAILHAARWPLLGMGVVSGFLGTLPSMVWALGALALVLAPLIALLAVWLYTLVFAFASLWFAHFTLARLQSLRAANVSSVPPTALPESANPA